MSPNNGVLDFQTSKQEPINENQFLKKFFSQYPKFQYQPRISPITEFNRLCKEYRWKKDSPEKKDALCELNLALILIFNSLYGSDEEDINNWHKICHVVRIDPLPNTVEKCRAVRATFDIAWVI